MVRRQRRSITSRYCLEELTHCAKFPRNNRAGGALIGIDGSTDLAKLERKPGDKHTTARRDIHDRGRYPTGLCGAVDIAEPARDSAVRIPRHRRFRIGIYWIVDAGAIEHIGKLDPQIQAGAFLDPKRSAEIEVFLRPALFTVVVVIRG
jgi:hypothetical protein